MLNREPFVDFKLFQYVFTSVSLVHFQQQYLEILFSLGGLPVQRNTVKDNLFIRCKKGIERTPAKI